MPASTPTSDRSDISASRKSILVGARRQKRKLGNRLREAIASNKKWRIRKATDLFLASRSVRLLALMEADKKLARKARKNKKGHTLLSEQRAVKLVDSVDLFSECEEIAVVTVRDKPDRRYRLTYDFRLVQRARQHVARWCLNAFLEPDEGQYALNGGRDLASSALRAALQAGEYKWAVIADVRDCFPSLIFDCLAERLPLPRRVIEMTVVTENIETVQARRQSGALLTARALQTHARGIPQGSCVSNIVAEMALAPIVREVRERSGQVFNFSDNFLVLAGTREEAAAVEHLLLDASRRHTMGEFVMRSSIVRVDHGFEFLGYHWRARNGRTEARPKDAKLAEFRSTVTAKAQCGEPVESYIAGFCGQYPEWEHRDTAARHWATRAAEIGAQSAQARALSLLANALSRPTRLRRRHRMPSGFRSVGRDRISIISDAIARISGSRLIT